MLGPIRMEILCGIRDEAGFQTIQKQLATFPDPILEEEVLVTAARFFNLCRNKGIQGSNTDFVICACSMLWKMPILTKDKDFVGYRELLPIDLSAPRTQ